MRRVVSLGLDGAAWRALDPMLEAGELPNLATLVDAGTRAPLRSVNPPVTCPAWRCSTAGKHPGNVGVYWWLTLDRSTGTLRTPDAQSFTTADIWDYLAEADRKSAVLNVPMTYPPASVDGVMVSGFGAPFDLDVSEPLTTPPELEQTLRDDYGWEIGIDDVTAPNGPERTYELIRSRFELLSDLLESERFAYHHLTIFYINVLQHKYGDGEETREGWRVIDACLGDLTDQLESFDDDILTVLYSDHGHAHIENTFVVNRYLAENGYLTFEDSSTGSLGERLFSGLRRLGVSPRRVASTARYALPDRVYQAISPDYPIPTGEVDEQIDWPASDAMALSQGPVYLNRDRLGAEFESVRAELAEELEALSYGGEQLFDSVYRREEIYGEDPAGTPPDLMLVPTEGWEIYGGITPETFETQLTSWTSGNHPRGMLVLHGDDVDASTLDERSLVDVMPTVLRYLGCQPPSDIDGTAITTPFDAGTLATGYQPPIPVTTGETAADDDEVRGRLRDLGYLE